MIHFSGGHGMRIPHRIVGSGWDIPNLDQTKIEIKWKRPDGTVVTRLSTSSPATSSDVLVTKASDNSSVTIGLLVKPGDHDQVGRYTIESFDLTGGNRIPAQPFKYRIKPAL